MKTKRGFASGVAIGFFVLLTLAAWAQVGFNMEEKTQLEKYKRANPFFEDGKSQYIKQKFDKAEKSFKKCLEIMPDFADASYFLAQIYNQRGELDTGLKAIEKAKVDFATLAKFYTFTQQQRLDTMREQLKNLEEKFRTAQESASQISPTSQDGKAELMKRQATAQSIKNEMDKINTQLSNPIPMVMDTPADYYYIHGNILFKQKRFADAIPQYTEAIARDRKHEFAYNNLANIYLMQRNAAEAMNTLKKAEEKGIKINPKLKEAILKAAGN